MIVDTMTYEEVGDSILKAARKSLPKIGRLLNAHRKAYMRIIRNSKKERCDFKPIPFKYDGIDFYIFAYSLGKQYVKKHQFPICLVAKVLYRKTVWYCLVSDGMCMTQLFQKHFFERYIERHLKTDYKVDIDIVRRYLKETNYVSAQKIFENPLHENCLYGATNIGICCGYHCKYKMAIWLTYIDKETLTLGAKKDIFDESREGLEPIGVDCYGIPITRGEWGLLTATNQ